MPTPPSNLLPTDIGYTEAISADTTQENNYDPSVAQAPEGQGFVAGNPTSDCYALRLEPFNECGNYRSILEIDSIVTAQYANIVRNISGENVSNPFIEGLVRFIYSQMLPFEAAVRRFTNSVFSQVGGTSYWVDGENNKYYPTDAEYNDASIDRTGWIFVFEPGVPGRDLNAVDFVVYSGITSCIYKVSQAIAPYIPFDISGNNYPCDCKQLHGTPFTLEDSAKEEALDALRYVLSGGPLGEVLRLLLSGGLSGVAEIEAQKAFFPEEATDWPETVAKYGPDAVRRGIIDREDDRYELEASFFGMCYKARECIKEYRTRYPLEYGQDVAAMPEYRLEILSKLQNFEDNELLTQTSSILTEASKDISVALQYATRDSYYEMGGLLHSEVLYKVAIVASAIKNVILILKESLNAVMLSDIIAESEQVRREQEAEYLRKLAEEAEKRAIREEILAERLNPDLCRIPEQPIPNPCLDTGLLNASKTKTFLDNWTAKDRTEPYYSPDNKKYYIVYDVILQNFADLTNTVMNSYKAEAYRILNNTFKLNMVELEDIDRSVEILVRNEPNGKFYEPRAFKPSKLLFSMTEETVQSLQRTIDTSLPRFVDPGPNAPFIKTYSYTIQEFFDSLEGFENVLKKYVFDHALWKMTFGNENPAVTNLRVSAGPIFEKLKLDILKQDSKNFQKFKPLFSKLLSRNGISLQEEVSLQKKGEYLMGDRIMLVFQFEQAEGSPPPQIEGTNVVAPPAINTLTSPPTNNAGSGLVSGVVPGKNIKLYRVQIINSSRPPTDLIWKSVDGTGDNLGGLNSQDVFMQETAMNYLMNLNVLLPLLRPDKKDWK